MTHQGSQVGSPHHACYPGGFSIIIKRQLKQIQAFEAQRGPNHIAPSKCKGRIQTAGAESSFAGEGGANICVGFESDVYCEISKSLK